MSTHGLHNNRFAVAVAASSDYGRQMHMTCLSKREHARFEAINAPDRRNQWLAGRLAAKYLFLHQINNVTAAGSGSPIFVPVTSDCLQTFSPRMYGRVEVLPTDRPSGGAPRLIWDGVELPDLCVSLTHTEGLTCACLTEARTLGIDVEQTLPRIGTFYRGNFTESERHWVIENADACVSSDWLFTLLWTHKEAILKANVLDEEISVWDFPRVDVQAQVDPGALTTVSRQTRLGDAFAFYTAHVTGPAGCADVRVALTATPHLVLTILNT